MAGDIELFTEKNASFRFRLTAPDGTVVVVSKSFPDKKAAMAGISAVREYAGTGLITDLCPEYSTRGSGSGTGSTATGGHAFATPGASGAGLRKGPARASRACCS